MINKIIYILSGIVLLLLGLQISARRNYHDTIFDYHYSFGPKHFIGGIFISSIGIIIIVLSLLRIKSKSPKEKFYVCPKCDTAYDKNEVLNGKCPKCKTRLRDLKGFYKKNNDENPVDQK